MKRSSARSRLRIVLTAIFAVGFVWSLFMTFSSFAAANLFKIQDAKLSNLSANVSGTISSFDESTIVSNVTFHKLNDSAKYTITLKNTDSKDHIIESISDDNENAHISYLYDSYANTLVKAGDSFDFVVTAKYTNAVTDMNARAQATNVKFMIKYLDIAEPEAISVNPSTGDEIAKNVIILAISATGLIICIAIALKRNKKLNKVAAIAIAAVAATTIATSVKAATVEVNSFTLTTNYGFYDKVVIIYTDKNGDEQELISNYNEPANIPDQSKDGYTLTGWEDEQGNPVDPTQPITEDIKIHPVYRAHTYTIRFNGNGATSGEMADLAMTFDEAKTLPANAFNFSGRTYTGWDTEANGSGAHYGDQAEVKNLTTEDGVIVTLYAQWSINPFHIDYDGNGATSGEMAQTNCEYDQSCILRDNAFSKPGYHFAGWKYNNNDYANKADVKNIIESGTITMVAQWAVNHYTIVFDINTDDASATGNMADMANLEYDRDYTLTANAFTRTGYNFGGWNTEIDGRNFGLTDAQEFHNLTTTDNAVITLYAQWDPIHYTIAFHQNSDGVTGNMSSQVFTYDEAKNLSQNAFIKNHYKFMGWTTAANGTGTKYDDRASIFNLTTEDGATIDLYAQWKERTAYLKGTVNNSWGSAGDMIRGLPGYANATAFRHYEGEPNFDEIETKNNMALNMSNFPVYTWIDGETIYWWSEAETIYAHEDSRNFFSGLKKAETIDYSGFNFSLTKNLAGFFRNTAALSTIDLSPLAAANPTTLEEMFCGSGITSVDLSPLNTTQTINMKGMFDSTTALETVNLSAIDTTNVTDMSYLFNNSANLKSVDFSHNNLSSVENMSNMFRSDKKLESLNFTGVNTPNLKKMSWMFGGAKIANLDLSDLDTGNVTHFDELFYYADVANLDISGFDTHNATTFGSMFTSFNAHGQVLDLSHFDTTSLNGSMYEMFLATNASVIDLSSFDISAERAANIGMANILYISNSVETIYATEKLHFHDYSSVPDTNLGVPMDYGGQSKLVGGAGSTLRQLTMLGLSEYDKARIDDPDNDKPGMFTIKNARYIRYNGNGADNATPYGAMRSEYLKAGDSLKKNAFTRDGYVFNGWKDADNNEYADEQVMADLTESKTPLELYAQWKEKSSTLQSGTNVNQIMRNLNADATSFRKFPGTPTATTLENAQLISVSESNYPAYMWNDGDTLYWWSEAEKVYLSNGGSFFYNMQKLETIDVVGLDTSKVKSMRQMFMNCYALASLDLSTFNTSAVTDMANMFSNDTSLTSLNVTSFDTSKVGQMNGIFQGFAGEVLDLSSFDTSSVGGNVIAFFSTTNNLKTVYVGDKWTATIVDIPSTTPLAGGAGSTSGGARLDNPDNNSRGRLSKKGARYIRYNGNGADNATPYGAMTSHYLKAGDSLKKNTFTRGGYVFTGWKDADNNEYTDEQVMTSLTESKTPLELYAQWDVAPYTVTFNTNGGEVLQGTKTVTYLQPYGELPTPVKYDYANSILGGKYSFKEWNTKADGSGDTITPSSIYENTDDITLYAIWNDRFTVMIYNGESETPTIASYGIGEMVYLNAQNVTGKQFLYWEVDGAKKSYIDDCSMYMFQGKDLTIRAIYGSESDLESQQPGTYISDIYRQYNSNKIIVRSYSYVPDGYKIVRAGVIATFDANIANGTFDDQTATYVRPDEDNDNINDHNYYFTWSKSSVTSEQTVYVKAYLKYKDADGVEHTIYGDLVTATLTE